MTDPEELDIYEQSDKAFKTITIKKLRSYRRKQIDNQIKSEGKNAHAKLKFHPWNRNHKKKQREILQFKNTVSASATVQ